MAVEGATTREVFEVYVEHFLGPALRPGQIAVMDNLGAHKPERVRELIEERDCELLFLPPYSPLPTSIRSSNLCENVKLQSGSRMWFCYASSPTEHPPSFERARSGLGYASCPHVSCGRRRP